MQRPFSLNLFSSPPASRDLETDDELVDASPARVFLPAFGALMLAAGASLWALAHFFDFGRWIGPLLGILMVAGAVSFGARCGGPRLRRVCAWGRWPLALAMLPLMLTARASWLASGEESNAVMAVILGWMTVASVILVGARVGDRSLPWRAPLVPGLALLGLLSLLSVEGVMQGCFLVFAAAALYLSCYERCLQLYTARLSSAPATAQATAPATNAAVSRREGKRWFLMSGVAAGAWFMLLTASGTLFYRPLEAWLPQFDAQENRWNQSALPEQISDYSGSDSFMELRGGANLLSDRPVMRVTPRLGEGTGLWRGRTYEYYTRSRWDDKTGERNIIPLRRRGGWRRQAQFDAEMPPVTPSLGRVEAVEEQIDWLGDATSTFYASGEPTLWQSQPTEPPGDNRDRASNPSNGFSAPWRKAPAPRRGYRVTSLVVHPVRSELLHLRGYNEAAADEAADEAQSLRINLQLPTDQKTRIALQTIARGIVASRPSRPQTPYAKVRAINGYLMQNCLYSLSSPPVPPTEDGAVFFLTQSRVGACDMFASSMTLLLRSLDVPARVATGYLRTEPTAAGKTYLVRERDAHAWVEFYVPQLGWMPFDPTADTRSLQLAETPLAALQFPRLNWPASSLILPAAGAFLLLLGALWPILEKRRASSEPNDETALRRHIAQIYAQAQKSLHSRVPGAPHLTPHEYEDRVSRARLPLDAKQEFAALTFLFIAARYGAVPPIAAAEVEGCLKRFQRALKGRK